MFARSSILKDCLLCRTSDKHFYIDYSDQLAIWSDFREAINNYTGLGFDYLKKS